MIYDITASIVLFNNNFNELKPIIELVNNTNLNIKLVFIDNSKRENKDFKINTNHKFQYIHTGKNLGYGKGQNEALKIIHYKSKFHIFLSSDIKLEKNFFYQVNEFMSNNQKVFVSAPKILNYNNSLQFSLRNFPTPLDLFLRLIPKKINLFQKIKNKYEIQKTYDDNKFLSVPVVSGAVVIFKNKIDLNKILFDKRYFMYMEDVDWCRKIKPYYEIYYNPEIVIYHKQNASSKKNIFMFFAHLYSAFKYFNKWGWFLDRTTLSYNNSIKYVAKSELKNFN
tara:strand:+ start:1810 stop:2652 length:843 start_codon:yes stop_codon:yes gene_type:complete